MEAAPPKNLFFYELCRLCLENAGSRDIFETSYLIEDIYNCTGVKVSCSDNLPRKICIKCADVVANSKELRLLATKNDVHLRTLFGGAYDGDPEGDTQPSNHSNHETSSIPESGCSEVKRNKFENSPYKNQSSSKEKLSLLLKDNEEKEATPVIRQTISLRKDLFPPSSQTSSPFKSQTEVEPDGHRLLQIKVETENSENSHKKIKMGDGDDEETEFICGTCCKAFPNKKKLYLHQRLHNKKIYCPLDACGKKFATKGDLVKHLRTHTGEKPFLCKICDKGFTQRVSLRAHITSVHSKDGKEAKEEGIEDKIGSVVENSQG